MLYYIAVVLRLPSNSVRKVLLYRADALLSFTLFQIVLFCVVVVVLCCYLFLAIQCWCLTFSPLSLIFVVRERDVRRCRSSAC